MAVRERGRSNLLLLSGLMMGLALVAITIAYGWGLKQIGRVQKEDICIQRASLIADALERYALDHDGLLPSGWEELTRGSYLPVQGDFYRCPLDEGEYIGPPSFGNTSYEVRWGLDLVELDQDVQREWLTAYQENQFAKLLVYHKAPPWLVQGHRHSRRFRQLSVDICNKVAEQLGSPRSR